MADRLNGDVAIVGGGLVGATMGIALARGGLRAIVVDRDDPNAVLRAAHDGRTSAIALASQRLLSALALWPDLADDAQPILDIRVADGDSRLFVHYDHRQVGDAPMGWMLTNLKIREVLHEHASAQKDMVLLAPARPSAVSRDVGGVTVTLDDGRSIRAALVIGADGRRSMVRGHAGIGTYEWRYRQSAIVCTVRHERPHRGVAVEHFLPSGPFAILPMTGNRSSVVWTERDDLAPGFMKLDDAGFIAALERRFGGYLGRLELEGPRFAHPLGLQHAHRYTDRRLALIGDAAHGMHPIAGQGLNMGLRDVGALADVLIDTHGLGLDIGSLAVLRGYERWRRFDNTLMLALTDTMNRLFSNRIAPLKLARDVGMALVDRIPALKAVLMRHAMGLSGELPKPMQRDR